MDNPHEKKYKNDFLTRESNKHPIITMIRQKADEEFISKLNDKNISIFKEKEINSNKSLESFHNYKDKIKTFYKSLNISGFYQNIEFLLFKTLDKKYLQAKSELANRNSIKLKEKHIREEERKKRIKSNKISISEKKEKSFNKVKYYLEKFNFLPEKEISFVYNANKQSYNLNDNAILEILENIKEYNLSEKLFKKRRIKNFFRTMLQIMPSWILERQKPVIQESNKLIDSIFYKLWCIIRVKTNYKYNLFFLGTSILFYFNLNTLKKDINKTINLSNTDIYKLVRNKYFYLEKIHQYENELSKMNDKNSVLNTIQVYDPQKFSRIKENEILSLKYLCYENEDYLNSMEKNMVIRMQNIISKDISLTCLNIGFLMSIFGSFLLKPKLVLPSIFLSFNIFYFTRDKIFDSLRTNIINNCLDKNKKLTLGYYELF